MIRFAEEPDYLLSCRHYLHSTAAALDYSVSELDAAQASVHAAVVDTHDPALATQDLDRLVNDTHSRLHDVLDELKRTSINAQIQSHAKTVAAHRQYITRMGDKLSTASMVLVRLVISLRDWCDTLTAAASEAPSSEQAHEQFEAWAAPSDTDDSDTAARMRKSADLVRDTAEMIIARVGSIPSAADFVEQSSNSRAERLEKLLDAGAASVTLSQYAAVVRPSEYGSLASVKRLVTALVKLRVQATLDDVAHSGDTQLSQADIDRMVCDSTHSALDTAREEVYTVYAQTTRERLVCDDDNAGVLADFIRAFVKSAVRKAFQAAGRSSAISKLNEFVTDLYEEFQAGAAEGLAARSDRRPRPLTGDTEHRRHVIDVLSGWQ